MALSDNDFQSLLTQLGYMPSKKEPIASVDPDIRTQQLLTGTEKPSSDSDNQLLQDYLSSKPEANVSYQPQETPTPVHYEPVKIPSDDSAGSPMVQAELKAGNPSGGSNTSFSSTPPEAMSQSDEQGNPLPENQQQGYPGYTESEADANKRVTNNLDTAVDIQDQNTAMANKNIPGQTPPAAMPNADTSGNLPGTQPSAPTSPTTPSPASTPQSTNPLEQAGVNDQAFQDAQQQARNKGLVASIGEGLGTFASEAAGKKFDPSFYTGLQNRAHQPVKDIETRRDAMIKSLTTAGIMTDLAVKNMNLKEQQDMHSRDSSATQGYKRMIEHYEPWLKDDKSWNEMNGVEAVNATKYLETNAKLETAKANNEFNREFKLKNQQDREEKDKLSASDKKQKHQLAVHNLINTMQQSSRKPAGIAGKTLLNADRALDTLNDPKVTIQDAQNISADIASIYNGGTATDSATKHNQYNTYYGQLQGLLQKVTGAPQNALPEDLKVQIRSKLMGLRNISSEAAKKNFAFVERTLPEFAKENPGYWDEAAKALADELESTVPEEQNNQSKVNITHGTTNSSPTGNVPAKRVVSSQDLTQYAQKHNISVDAAKNVLSKVPGISFGE